jgi:hypothetical protein
MGSFSVPLTTGFESSAKIAGLGHDSYIGDTGLNQTDS